MQSRLGALQQKGITRRDLKYDVDIHAGYDPRLNELKSPEQRADEREELHKLIKKEREVGGRIIPEVGKKIAARHRKIAGDAIKLDVKKQGQSTGDEDFIMQQNIASIDPDISPRDMKQALLKHADKRRSKGELGFRGEVGRKKREKGGQLNLFGR
jgi:hypothetical protein